MNPMTFGDKLRALRESRGYTLRQLAEKSHHSRSKLSNWEHHRPPLPTEDDAKALDAILDGDGQLAAALRVPGLNGASDRIAAITAAPRTVDEPAVTALAGTLGHMRRLEDSLGAQRLLVITAEPLRLVEQLADEARGDLRPAVVDLAGQWSQFAGWLRAAVGQPGQARDWYRRALEYAEEVDGTSTLPTGRELIATALSMRGHLAWSARKPGPTIGMSAAAAEKSRAPGIQAMALQQKARGHALAGEASEVDPLLDAAEILMAAARERPEEAPPWIYFYTPGYLQMQRGLAYRLLGRVGAAADALTAGLKAAGREVADAEFVAVYKLALAETQLDAGNPDVARRYLDEARATATATGSAGLAGEVARIEARLPD
ncbi:helix-turn-helix transcriptional regulator [Actinoplanes sp. NPDC023936]|uniref:helix-turn-helix domain-containing protein n=1 Tax=Actinoplanes sp. NPDC023936 TaxID=3154910 RepID=UPI0033C4584B